MYHQRSCESTNKLSSRVDKLEESFGQQLRYDEFGYLLLNNAMAIELDQMINKYDPWMNYLERISSSRVSPFSNGLTNELVFSILLEGVPLVCI